MNHVHDKAAFQPPGVAEYRQTIKGRLKHWRKLCNLSQAQAAKLAGVARSTWQTWEDSARDALPDVAALAAVADAARIEPSAALDWLIGGADRRAL
ncbi:MAG: helix-turn-helix transcriptional regulator [Christensenellales bacterium]